MMNTIALITPNNGDSVSTGNSNHSSMGNNIPIATMPVLAIPSSTTIKLFL